ncbi:adenosylcobinamide-phosphate synthase CbiB [Sphingobium subterraneum]|uniref:Cobalamin biosynthesis protein CobD n=1 Tax=Sphingobium subterraneum TaxID=627688 RepID=A0A841IV80_9SPHN|nr:adenosylcobinamide-phosphate synthase CbiB [Sphingobium subterraneum]MBB6122829.1 adenosylcobinamide-phosphate synthase [Sphingobium subterraneum]
MGEPVALAALALDAAVGWPTWLYVRIGHPVSLFAWIIKACERRWNDQHYSDARQRFMGVLTLVLLLGVGGGAGWLIQHAIVAIMGTWSWPLLALAAWPALAQRSLYEHVVRVFHALRADDIVAARKAAAMIVGRDTDTLDLDGVARAAVESLAESFCDGVAAPLFWLLLLGLPGVWVYKAINTADSMIGHIESPYRHFGWAAARTDDLANLLPARLSAILLCIAGRRGWHILWRDHDRHASPNAGWPEAAMAGALGVRLGGPVSYDGTLADKPWIGDGPSADSAALERALKIYIRACALLWIVVSGVTWLR